MNARILCYNGQIQPQRMQIKRYNKGETIFLDGGISNRIYAVFSGLIKTVKYTANGEEHILKLVTGSNYLGIDAIQDNYYSYSAKAVTDSEVCVYTREVFLSIVKDSPEMHSKMLNMLSLELTYMRNRMIDLKRKTAIQKVAAFLLTTTFLSVSDVCWLFKSPLTRQEISNYLGVQPETLSRVLHRLGSEGVIQVEFSKIWILDPLRLLSMSD